MTVRQKLIVVCAYGLCLVSAPDIKAYEEIPIADSGSLRTVYLDGADAEGYNLTTVPDRVYGRLGKGWRLLQPFDVGPKEFRRVVVYLGESTRETFRRI